MRNTRTTLRSFPGHYRPQADAPYYAPLPCRMGTCSTGGISNSHDSIGTIKSADTVATTHTETYPGFVLGVVFPFYNETRQEMERSLHQFQTQLDVANSDSRTACTEHILLTMDGWDKCSDSMKTYLKDMFPHTGSDEPWWETIDAAPADVVTYIVQREDTEGQLVPVKFHDGRSLNLCLLVKRDNRKKHNSHEWFFSCAKVFGAKYALTTDCGTLYDSECTYRLLRHMEENEGVQTCTGRQRVMSMGMQEVEKGDSLMEMWYRSIQAFDYEVSITSFQAAFALVGFLPVIPGPLGMWRMEGLDDALEHYYTIASAKQTGELIQGNLLLAEDRILSYGAVFFTKKRADWVLDAKFYSEAEVNPSVLIAQRRRWTNGSVMGYLYLLLAHPEYLKNSPQSLWFKFNVLLLLCLQLLMFMLATLSPAFIGVMSFWAISYTAHFFAPDWLTYSEDQDVDYYTFGFLGLYLGLYTLMVAVHYFRKWVGPIYNLWTAMGVCIMINILLAVSVSIMLQDIVTIVIIVMGMGMPILLAALHDWSVLFLVLINLLPYLLMIPTFVGGFSAYASARIWDLSWGNRPTEAKVVSVVDDEQQKREDERLEEEKELKRAEQRIERLGLAYVLCIYVANIFLTLILCLLGDKTTFFYVALCIMPIPLIQQLYSAMFYIKHLPRRIQMAFFYHKTSDIYDQHVREKPCVRILDRIASQWHRIVTFLATALAFGLVLYAFLSDQWVEVEGSLVYDYVSIGLYKVTMGLAGYHVTVPTDAYKYNAQGVEANKYYSSADVSGLFGLNLLYDFPSSTLGLLAWLQFLVLASVGIVLLTMTYMWLFHQSVETRTDLVAGLYLAASFVLTLVIVLVYPLSISQLHVPSEREMTVHMCGADAGPYNPGNCSLGIGYWVVVGSLVPLLVGCVASNQMTLSPYLNEERGRNIKQLQDIQYLLCSRSHTLLIYRPGPVVESESHRPRLLAAPPNVWMRLPKVFNPGVTVVSINRCLIDTAHNCTPDA